MSLLLLASMPAASPDGPSDAEEGERRINAPPGNGQQKRAAHLDVRGLAPRTDRLRLPRSRSCSRASAHSNRDAAAGFGFRLRTLDLTNSSAMNSAQEDSVR